MAAILNLPGNKENSQNLKSQASASVYLSFKSATGCFPSKCAQLILHPRKAHGQWAYKRECTEGSQNIWQLTRLISEALIQRSRQGLLLLQQRFRAEFHLHASTFCLCVAHHPGTGLPHVQANRKRLEKWTNQPISSITVCSNWRASRNSVERREKFSPTARSPHSITSIQSRSAGFPQKITKKDKKTF